MKNIVITGGTSDIAQGIVNLSEPEENYRFHLISRGIFEEDFSSQFIHTYEGSVDSEHDLNYIRDIVLSDYGSIDGLITCAAYKALSCPIEELELDEWHNLMGVDLDGVFLACKIFGSEMQYGGRIINMTSFHNIATYPNRVAYNAAKSGVEGLSRALAVEWGKKGITVNCIAPGPISTTRTNWFLENDPEAHEGMLNRTPNGKIGEVEDVANTVKFLLSDGSRHITGQQIVIDGGWTKNSWWGKYNI